MSLYDKLSNFPTTTKAGATTDSNGGAAYVTYKQITGLPVGVLISSVTFDVYSTPTDTSFKGGVYTDSGNNPTTLLASGELTNQNVSNTYTTLSIPLTSNATVPSNGIVWVAIIPNKTNPLLRVSTSSPSYTNSKFSTTTGSYTNYSNWMLSTASVQGSGENNVRFGVVYTTSVAKQRFVENFSGTGLDIDRWRYNNLGAGTITVKMADEVDGGIEMTTDASSNASYAIIDFNDICQYDSTSSGFILVGKAKVQANTKWYGGLEDNSYFVASYNGNEPYYRLGTRESSAGSTNTATTVASDIAWHTHKAETNGTSVPYWIDGVLAATSTSFVPTGTQSSFQPFIEAYGNANKTSQFKYFEAYNI
jgi:hypothetical protein